MYEYIIIKYYDVFLGTIQALNDPGIYAKLKISEEYRQLLAKMGPCQPTSREKLGKSSQIPMVDPFMIIVIIKKLVIKMLNVYGCYIRPKMTKCIVLVVNFLEQLKHRNSNLTSFTSFNQEIFL